MKGTSTSSSSAAPADEEEEAAYAGALTRLAQLQSNLATRAAFVSLSSPRDRAALDAASIPTMLAWLRRAGYTPRGIAAAGLRCVHVAGTKGKGSVSALVGSILGQYSSSSFPSSSREEGQGREGNGKGKVVVGVYTSPHVVSVRERIVLGGVPIRRGKFARYVAEVWERFTRAAMAEEGEVQDVDVDGPATKPFYFGFLTVLALHVFLAEGVRDAVIECGIGGEYDSTNVLPAEAVTAAVVTQLGIDHVSMLGGTLEEIAWQKSGIFKPGVKAFTRRLPESQRGVMEVLRARAREKGATLVEVADEEVEEWEGVEGARLQGPFQKYNMALAVYAAREHLLRTGVQLQGRFGTDEWSLKDIPPEFVKGLKEASLRGRCEILKDEDGIEWHLDGAHTDDSLAGVGRWFASKTRGEDAVRILVFNLQERDPSVLLKALLAGAREASNGPVFTHAIFTRNEEQTPMADEDRDLSAQTMAQETMRNIEPATKSGVYNAVHAAVDRVRGLAAQTKKDGKPCKVLVTGSFFLVGSVLKTIGHVEY
ncbi:hypothetical protein VTK56DRAFT_2056 [Thermocarpiscus australiensis]